MAEPVELAFIAYQWPEDNLALLDFLSRETWPYHGQPQVDAAVLAAKLQAPDFLSPDLRYFWIMAADERVGLIKLFDLEDIADQGSPLFDLRIRAQWRGQGLGLQAVRWLTAYLFETWPTLQRIEGTTREDNWAMRRLFLRCGYAKEGHLRKAWDQQHAAILYGILREDWESGKITPVPWHDEPANNQPI